VSRSKVLVENQSWIDQLTRVTCYKERKEVTCEVIVPKALLVHHSRMSEAYIQKSPTNAWCHRAPYHPPPSLLSSIAYSPYNPVDWHTCSFERNGERSNIPSIKLSNECADPCTCSRCCWYPSWFLLIHCDVCVVTASSRRLSREYVAFCWYPVLEFCLICLSSEPRRIALHRTCVWRLWTCRLARSPCPQYELKQARGFKYKYSTQVIQETSLLLPSSTKHSHPPITKERWHPNPRPQQTH